MIVGIHNTYPHKPDKISDMYREILKANAIEFIDLNCNTPDFWEKVRKIDAFIYRWAHTDYHHQIAKTILPVIEHFFNVPCFPNMATCWHYDDKIRQYYLLKSTNFPYIESNIFWDKHEALEWVKTSHFPRVFKLKSGSGSLQVKLVKNRRRARSEIQKMFNRGQRLDRIDILHALKIFNYDLPKVFKHLGIKFRNRYFSNHINPYWCRQRNYILFQKYLLGNLYDTRVQITGARAYAFVRYNRMNDFRASGSNKWSIDHNKIDMEFVKIAFEISDYFKFQSMAYDFLYDENKKPAIAEISYCFGDYPEFSTGYWDKDLNWHTGRFIPQYFELIDLLQIPDLVLPDHVTAASKYANVPTDN